jgi:hypothetical protein
MKQQPKRPSVQKISIGEKLGRLTINGFDESRNVYMFQCECGTLGERSCNSIMRKSRQSCGCWHKEITSAYYSNLNKKHGNAGKDYTTQTLTYNRWHTMKRRCRIKTGNIYRSYAAKGITVCDEWSTSFETFLADMGECPSKSYSLDRIDNNKGYSKDNCRWATAKEQSANRGNTTYVVYQGEKVALCLLYHRLKPKVPYSTFWARVVNLHWDISDALSWKFS